MFLATFSGCCSQPTHRTGLRNYNSSRSHSPFLRGSFQMEGSHVQDDMGPFCLLSGLPSPQSRASSVRRNQDEADVRFSPALTLGNVHPGENLGLSLLPSNLCPTPFRELGCDLCDLPVSHISRNFSSCPWPGLLSYSFWNRFQPGAAKDGPLKKLFSNLKQNV